jgi:SulP family sulfate permease
MEATSISRAVAASTGQRLDPNREFMAQGLANVGGAFFSCFASSGSLTRTALNYQAGARTRAAGMISAATVAVVVLLLGPLGQYVPIPALAGLLIVAAWQMVNRERLVLAFRAGWESACVLVVTAAAVLLVRIDWAIYIGVGLSLAFFIKQSSALYVSILIPTEDDQFQDASLEEVDPERIHGRILVLNVVGAMYFGAMDEYRAAIERTFDANPRAVILRLRRVTNLDSSGLATLKDLHEQLRDRGIPLVLCGVDRWLLRVLRHARLVRAIGEDRVLASGDLMFNSMRHALGLARELAAGESARRHAGAGSGEEAPEERG